MTSPRNQTRWNSLLAAVLVTAVSLTSTSAAEPAKSADERIAKVRTDLKSEDATVRQSAIGSLVHSDISPKLLAEMRTAAR